MATNANQSVPSGTPDAGGDQLVEVLNRLTDSQNRVDAAQRVPKIPGFFRQDPALCFLQVESSFSTANVRAEETKADYIVANLDFEIVAHVKDILSISPTPADICTRIKNRIISGFSASPESRLPQLLKGEVLSDGKPSVILNRLRSLNDNACSEEVIKSIFLEQLPNQIEAILALSNIDNLDDLAKMADKVTEAAGPGNFHISSVTSGSLSNSSMASAVTSKALPDDLETKQITWSWSWTRMVEFTKPKYPRPLTRQEFYWLMFLPRKVWRKGSTMPEAMQVGSAVIIGKLVEPPRAETVGGSGKVTSKRLHLSDRNSGLVFLIDTGSDLSLLPVDKKNKPKPSDGVLYAANDTPEVPYPIIGADFLALYYLASFLHASSLVDTTTGCSSSGFIKNASIFGVSTIDRTQPYSKILADFPEITSVSQCPDLVVHDVQHHIETKGPPIAERARRLSPDKLAAAKTQFQQMIDSGICRPSSSPWATPIHMTPKKDGDSPWATPIHMTPKKDGEWRICGDFRRLNVVTIPDRYPVPHLHDFSANLHGKSVFSKLYLLKAYHQIPIAPEDIPKMAVITPYIHRALGDLDFVFAYVDDILVASPNEEEHEKHLRIVFQRLKDFALRLNISKCQFGKSELEFLGHLVNRDGVKPTPEKVQAIVQFPKRRTIVELRRFLGLVNFYRRSLPQAAYVQAPLHSYLSDSRKNDRREIEWTHEAEEAFVKIKNDLANATLLSHPAFRHFIKGQDFKVITDHKPLVYAFTQRSKKASPRQQRQLAFIFQYTTRIEYLPGADNVVADSLSRVESIKLRTEWSLVELVQA
ncbi:uncharacterized protein LOC117177867 [Belonocnema kinseyi]|uniref:uncharacterized protein LOC117177867 n=1 Tax=Belonocnema kinseyi TaxID=2817044 RepID=UPI00143D01B3|nr:uncharacterized protein LOC117177867 [Belonocnema kinseyi]